MSQLIEFAMNHAMLVSAFALVLGIILYTEIARLLSGIPEVGTTQATHLVNREDALVLDVREDKEIADGIIINAKHLPLSRLKDSLSSIEQYKDKPIIVYCRSGNRSMQACKTLSKAGFSKSFNLSGGYTAWLSANLPVTKS